MAFLSIMPTAIDEYRFLIGKRRPRKLALRQPQLASRWPPQSVDRQLTTEAAYAAALYAPPAASDWTTNMPESSQDPEAYADGRSHLSVVESWPEYTGLLNVGGTASLPAFHPLIRGLESSIRLEVRSRDFLLVSWTDTLLVYRPFYESGSFSGGVRGEIELWDIAAATPGDSGLRQRRAAFIHFHEDLDLKLRTWAALLRSSGGLRQPVVENIRTYGHDELERMGYRSPYDRAKILAGQVPRGGWFAGGPFPRPDRVERDRIEAMREAVYRELVYQMTDVLRAQNSVSVWICRGLSEQRYAYGAIAQFLKGATPPRDEWKDPLEQEILPRITGASSPVSAYDWVTSLLAVSADNDSAGSDRQ